MDTPILISEDQRQEVLEMTDELMRFLHGKADGDILFAASILTGILIYRGQNSLELDMDLVNEACWWIDSQETSDTIN